MRLNDPVECLYLSFMLRWEKTAPPEGSLGLLDEKPERNTQISRMVYLLGKIAAGADQRTFNTLSLYARRKDGESYVSKNPTWMKDPRELYEGWFLEGCTSLPQKQGILQGLAKLGRSGTFVACANDFVAGQSVLKYVPTAEEQAEVIERLEGTQAL